MGRGSGDTGSSDMRCSCAMLCHQDKRVMNDENVPPKKTKNSL